MCLFTKLNIFSRDWNKLMVYFSMHIRMQWNKLIAEPDHTEHAPDWLLESELAELFVYW